MGLSQGSIGMGQPGMGQQLGPIGGPIGGPSQAGSFPQLGVAVKCLFLPGVVMNLVFFCLDVGNFPEKCSIHVIEANSVHSVDRNFFGGI